MRPAERGLGHMTSECQMAELDWNGAVPVARRFDDPYFSLADGLEETRHVFLAGNDLPQRFRDGFQIAELGFGTGLNMLATAKAWRDAGLAGTLHLTSFEAYPMSPGAMQHALAAFPVLAEEAARLGAVYDGTGGVFDLGDGVQLTLVIGDARATVLSWAGKADAWFLDGFAPAKNPQLWQPDLLAAVARHTAPRGTFATYTAAGAVRRGLAAAGFAVQRVPGYGRKRHMTIGTLESAA